MKLRTVLSLFLFMFILSNIMNIESIAIKQEYSIIAEFGLVCDAKKTKCIAENGVILK